MPRREDESALLHARDAAAGTAMRVAGTLPHLDEHQRAVAWIAHDEVDLAAAASGGSIIARDQAEARRLQVVELGIFRRVASLLLSDGTSGG